MRARLSECGNYARSACKGTAQVGPRKRVLRVLQRATVFWSGIMNAKGVTKVDASFVRTTYMRHTEAGRNVGATLPKKKNEGRWMRMSIHGAWNKNNIERAGDTFHSCENRSQQPCPSQRYCTVSRLATRGRRAPAGRIWRLPSRQWMRTKRKRRLSACLVENGLAWEICKARESYLKTKDKCRDGWIRLCRKTGRRRPAG